MLTTNPPEETAFWSFIEKLGLQCGFSSLYVLIFPSADTTLQNGLVLGHFVCQLNSQQYFPCPRNTCTILGQKAQATRKRVKHTVYIYDMFLQAGEKVNNSNNCNIIYLYSALQF